MAWITSPMVQQWAMKWTTISIRNNQRITQWKEKQTQRNRREVRATQWEQISMELLLLSEHRYMGGSLRYPGSHTRSLHQVSEGIRISPTHKIFPPGFSTLKKKRPEKFLPQVSWYSEGRPKRTRSFPEGGPYRPSELLRAWHRGTQRLDYRVWNRQPQRTSV